MSRTRPIRRQMDHMLREAHQRGGSKRSAKFDGQMASHVYGDKHFDALEDAAHRLSAFLESKNLKMLYQVNPEHIKEFLDERAKTCNANTMVKEVSYVRKLEDLAHFVYKKSTIDWGTKVIRTNDYEKKAVSPTFEKNKVIDRSIADRIAAEIKHTTKTNTWKAIIVSQRLGLRVDECSQIRIENFHLHPEKDDPKNVYGFGYYELPKGGHSKGNRPRIIPIHSKEDRETLETLCAGRTSGYLIENTRKPGEPVSAEAISKQFRNALKRLNLYDEYKGNALHGVRKNFAQEVYDLEKGKGKAKRDAMDAAQNQLGHGKGRNQRLQDTYIHNQW